MTAILLAWAVSAVALLALAAGLGWLVRLRPRPGPLGMLIDQRGRFSLNHLQLVVWTIVVVSLVSGVFFGRLFDGVHDPLGFTIPDRVLGLLGISVGAGVTAGAVKAAKSAKAPEKVASLSSTGKGPKLEQIFMLEEGEYADRVLDVTKFQSFGFTVILVVAYVAMAIHAIVDAKTGANLTALPDLSGSFLVLLGISYAGYVGGKLVPQSGVAPGAEPAAEPDGAAEAAPVVASNGAAKHSRDDLIVRSRVVEVQPTDGTLAPSAHCEPGEQVIAGGYDLGDSSLTVDRNMALDANGSSPAPGTTASQWGLQVHNTRNVATTVRVFAICAPLGL